MSAANEVIALDVIARFVQDRHSVRLRNAEDSREVRDLDEPKMDGYVPKTIIDRFYTDAVF